MSYVQNVEYSFQFSDHAKVGLAFRYGVEISESETMGIFLSRLQNNDANGRLECNLSINGRKVRAVVISDDNIVVTVLPNHYSLQTDTAKLLNSGFDLVMAATPDLFSYADIIEWGRNFIDSQSKQVKDFGTDELRREIRKRYSANIIKPGTQSTELHNLTLLNDAWEERAQRAWETNEQLQNEFKELESENRRLLQLNHNPEQGEDLKSKLIDILKSPTTNKADVLDFNIDSLDDTTVYAGTPSGGYSVGRNTRNHEIIQHDNCLVCDISLADTDNGDVWHEVVVKYEEKYFVLATKFKRYAKAYSTGDQTIFTTKYGGKSYLHANLA